MHGGIVPAERQRSSRVLSLVEREEISRGIAAGYTIRAIARGLDRAVSTVSQEVSLHGGRELYRPLKPTWQLGNPPEAAKPEFTLLRHVIRVCQHEVVTGAPFRTASRRGRAQSPRSPVNTQKQSSRVR